MSESREPSKVAEEAAWIRQALSGDQRGFAALMKRYHAPLRRMLRSMLRNPQDTDDLLQDTFLRAYRFLHRFDQTRPFGPWLFRIGANLARNQLRKRKRHPEVSLDEPVGESEIDGFEGEWLADDTTLARIEYRQLAEQTRRAIAKLPEDQRVILEMRLLGQMSYKEIADSLGIAIGTVMSRLSRGRARVQRHLAEFRDAEAGMGPAHARLQNAGPEVP